MKRKCDGCKSPVVRVQGTTGPKISTASIDTYELAGDVGQIKNNETRPIVRMAEPVLLNPNSFQNLETILDSSKRFANIPHQRKWVFLGPPYIIASKLMERNPERYECLAIVPGLGQQKTIFKILDGIIFEPLFKEVLNFEIPKAYSFL